MSFTFHHLLNIVDLRYADTVDMSLFPVPFSADRCFLRACGPACTDVHSGSSLVSLAWTLERFAFCPLFLGFLFIHPGTRTTREQIRCRRSLAAFSSVGH